METVLQPLRDTLPAATGQDFVRAIEYVEREKNKTRRLAPPSQAIAHAVTSLGAVSMWWAQRAAAAQWPQNTPRLPFWIEDDIGNMVAEARNAMVVRVRQAQNDKLRIKKIFWHDDDVILVSPKALIALESHDEPIVSGVYFTKGELCNPLIYEEIGHGYAKFVPNSCGNYWGHGMGLTLVDMEVYDRMEEELDLGVDCNGNPKWYHTSSKDGPKLKDGMWDMGGTEDLYFCENAAKLGYKPVVDCGVHAFGFHYDLFGDYGPPKTGYPREQWEEFRKFNQITWKTKEGEVVWR